MRSWPAVWRSGVAFCYGVVCAVWIREGVACGCATTSVACMAWPSVRLWRTRMVGMRCGGVLEACGGVGCALGVRCGCDGVRCVWRTVALCERCDCV